MRKLLVVLILGLAAAPVGRRIRSPNAGKKIHLEKVVAIVNDAIILQSELEARLQPVMQEAQQIPTRTSASAGIAKLTGQVLDDMVNEELIVQAAEAAKVEVDSSEVQAALDEIKQQNNLDDAGLQQALVQQGYSLQNYKADLRRQLLRFRAINTIVAPKVNITEEDIRAPLRSDAAPLRAGQRRADLRHPDQAARSPDRAADRRRQGEGGDARSIASRAARTSRPSRRTFRTTTSTKASGGELGWFERGSVNPDWEGIVFAMDKDEVRGPVNGPQGPLRLQGHRGQEVRSQALRRDEGAAEPRAAPPRARQADADLGRRAAQEGVHRHQAAVGRIRQVRPELLGSHHLRIMARGRKSPDFDSSRRLAARAAHDRWGAACVHGDEPVARRCAVRAGQPARDGLAGRLSVLGADARRAHRDRRDGALVRRQRRRASSSTACARVKYGPSTNISSSCPWCRSHPRRGGDGERRSARAVARASRSRSSISAPIRRTQRSASSSAARSSRPASRRRSVTASATRSPASMRRTTSRCSRKRSPTRSKRSARSTARAPRCRRATRCRSCAARQAGGMPRPSCAKAWTYILLCADRTGDIPQRDARRRPAPRRSAARPTCRPSCSRSTRTSTRRSASSRSSSTSTPRCPARRCSSTSSRLAPRRCTSPLRDPAST